MPNIASDRRDFSDIQLLLKVSCARIVYLAQRITSVVSFPLFATFLRLVGANRFKRWSLGNCRYRKRVKRSARGTRTQHRSLRKKRDTFFFLLSLINGLKDASLFLAGTAVDDLQICRRNLNRTFPKQNRMSTKLIYWYGNKISAKLHNALFPMFLQTDSTKHLTCFALESPRADAVILIFIRR